LTTRIPALINSLELWIEASKCNTEIDQDLIDLDSEGLRSSLEELVQAWEEDMDKIVSGVRLLRRKIKSITDANLVTCASWNAMHPSSYKAFINHNGTYETAAVKFRCWNTELIQNMNRYSAKRWGALDADAEAGLEVLCKTSMDRISRFQKEAVKARAPKAFLRNLKAWKRCLRHSQDLSVRELLQQLRRIKQNATSGHAASYVVSYMRPVYQECQNDYGESCRSLIPKPTSLGCAIWAGRTAHRLIGQQLLGTGVTARNRERLEQHVSQPKFVTDQEELATRDLTGLVDDTAKVLMGHIDKMISAIDADLETIQMPPIEGEALFAQYPKYGTHIEEILDIAREKMRALELVVQEKRVEAELKWK